MADPKRKYRIMRDFRIQEISGVDYPAQQGAVVAILKSRDGDAARALAVALESIDADPDLDETEKRALSDQARADAAAFVKDRMGDTPLPNNRHLGGGSFSSAAAARLDPGSDDENEEDDMSAPATLDEAVRRLRSRDPNLPRHAAMSRARRLWPDLLEKCREEQIAIETLADAVAKADLAKRRAPEVVAFEKRVDAIQERDRCCRFDALKRAAREMSRDEFCAYRDALD
jgi:hypothetical protein